jgi:hypothetical protein
MNEAQIFTPLPGPQHHLRQAAHPICPAGVWPPPARSAIAGKRTEWRSEVNSNCRYRFLKLSYDSIMLGLAIETGCEALLPRTAFSGAL